MTHELPVYDNPNALIISKENLAKADQAIGNIVDSLGFFKQRLHNDPKLVDVHTHMGLFESYFRELAGLVDYNSVFVENMNQILNTIGDANAEIRRLESLLGKDITVEGVQSKLRDYDNAFRCFYGACGFHYAHNNRYTAYHIEFNFSEQIEYEQHDGCSSRKDDWGPYFQDRFDLISNKNTKYDLYRDSYHAELLDTDNNRKLIQELFEQIFPNSRIHDFRSKPNDYGSWSLRFTVYADYRDIDKLIKEI